METDVKWPWNFSNHSIMNHWFNVWFKNEIFSLIQTFEKRNYVRNFFRESKTETILFIKKKKKENILVKIWKTNQERKLLTCQNEH